MPWQQQCKRLLQALHKGCNYRLVERLLRDLGPQQVIECRDPNTGLTPIHVAVVRYPAADTSSRVLQTLIYHSGGNAGVVDWRCCGSALNARDRTGATPLYLAALEGRLPALKQLLSAGAMPDVSTRQARTPLHAASQRNSPQAVAALLSSGAAVNAIDCRLSTPLHVAAHWGFSNVVDVLLGSEEIDVNMRNLLGWAPIHGAARRGHVAVVKRLTADAAATGINLDQQDAKGWTPLHHAADSGHTKTVEALLDAPAKSAFGIDMRESTQGVTALHYAAHRGHLDVAHLLLRRGASQTVASNDGWTPLHVACRLRRLDVVRLLLSRPNAPLHARGRRGWMPLHVAAYVGDADIVRCLLKHRADLTIPLKDSWTPLHLAAITGHAEAIEALLDAGADPTQVETRFQFTPLHTTVLFHHTQCALLLLNRCRDKNAPIDLFRDAVCPAELPILVTKLKDRASSFAAGRRTREEVNGEQLHAAMVSAGFVRSRAVTQAAAADHLQALIRDYASDVGDESDGGVAYNGRQRIRLCGSFAEGWGCSVTRLTGCVDEDSDIDLSEYAKSQLYHIERFCRCDKKAKPSDSPLVEETFDEEGNPQAISVAEVRGDAQMLSYNLGHVAFDGYASQPARTQYGCLGRPAMDTAVMYRCCAYPDVSTIKSPGYLPDKLVDQLRSEIKKPNTCPLVGASMPGMEGRQLRVSTKWFELPLVRGFTDVQGQLYTILKYLVKRVINRRGGQLKSFHAKTLAFRMVRETRPRDWQPHRLPQLTQAALEKLADDLERETDDGIGMRSFFFVDAPIYLKRGSRGGGGSGMVKKPTLAAVRQTLLRLDDALDKFRDQLQPLRKNAGIDYHPFMLLPRSKQIRQLQRRPIWRSHHAVTSLDQPLEYHELHEFVHRRLLELSVGGDCHRHYSLEAFLSELKRMPDCARTARETLAALAYLLYDKPYEAFQRLGNLLWSGHRPLRGLLVTPSTSTTNADDNAKSVRLAMLKSDSAWRFCFVQEAPQPSMRFDFLPPATIRFPRRLLKYDDFYAVNFDALAKSLYLQLRDQYAHRCNQLDIGNDERRVRAWFNEMLNAEMDASEMELLIWSCRRQPPEWVSLLQRLVEEHSATLMQSRTVHCLLANCINSSHELKTSLKQSFLKGLDL